MRGNYKMNHKLMMLSVFICIPFVTYSDNLAAEHPEDFVGLPKPNSGVTIVSHSKMIMTFPKEYLKEFEDHQQQQATKGYFDDNSDYAAEIIKQAANPSLGVSESKELMDTHYKKDLSSIKLAFKFTPPPIIQKGIVKYTPMGSTNNDGWTGIAMIFNAENVGACSLSLTSFVASSGGVQFEKEGIEYYVNNKPGDTSVSGNDKYGYIYNVTWADKKYYYNLECAAQSFNPNIMQGSLILARKIDSEMNK